MQMTITKVGLGKKKKLICAKDLSSPALLFYYAWQDPITWFAIVLIGVEWLLFFCSYKNTSMCDVDGRTSKARSMRYCGYFLSLIAFGLDCWSIFELINQGDNE
eukprot:493971_1